MVTFTGAAVTLPATPGPYFLGIVIDPNNKLHQLSVPTNRLEQIRTVGPCDQRPPTGGVLSSPLTGQFPNPPDGKPIGNVNTLDDLNRDRGPGKGSDRTRPGPAWPAPGVVAPPRPRPKGSAPLTPATASSYNQPPVRPLALFAPSFLRAPNRSPA